MAQERDDMVASMGDLTHPRIWEAFGHLDGFTDPLRDCRVCHLRFRADKLEDANAGEAPCTPGQSWRAH